MEERPTQPCLCQTRGHCFQTGSPVLARHGCECWAAHELCPALFLKKQSPAKSSMLVWVDAYPGGSHHVGGVGALQWLCWLSLGGPVLGSTVHPPAMGGGKEPPALQRLRGQGTRVSGAQGGVCSLCQSHTHPVSTVGPVVRVQRTLPPAPGAHTRPIGEAGGDSHPCPPGRPPVACGHHAATLPPQPT